MTQAEAILADLKRGKSITPFDALYDYGCLRLGARIYDLKRAGHPIMRRMVEDHRSGKRYAEYWMRGSAA